MNLRDLKYFVTLAESNHFGRAAMQCFVSQPALSMQLKKLEIYLGTALFERTGKNIILTQAGQAIYQHAKIILAEAENIKAIAKLTQNPLSGELGLGIIPTIAPYILPHIIKVIKQRLPDLALYLFEEQTDSLIEKLTSGKIDSAIISPPIKENNFMMADLFVEDFYLAVAKNHPLANATKIKQKNLIDQVLLLLDEGHCLRDQALAVCAIKGATEAKSFRATSLETLRYMVASNLGITLIPQIAKKNHDGICYIPFSNPKPTRQITLAWRQTSPKTQVLMELQTIISSIMKNVILKG